MSYIQGGSGTGGGAGGTTSPLNTQTMNYTLVLTDPGKTIGMNLSAQGTLTIPPFASVAFPTNSWLNVLQLGTGLVNIVAGVGVTLVSLSGATQLPGQYAMVQLYNIATDEWVIWP